VKRNASANAMPMFAFHRWYRRSSCLAVSPRPWRLWNSNATSLLKFGHEFMVQRVSELLKPVAAQVALISFDLPAIHHAQKTTHYPVGWVLTEYSSLTELKAQATVPNYLFCDHLKLPDDDSRLWRGRGVGQFTKSLTRALAHQLVSRGAQLIETMEIRRMLRELRLSRE